MDPDRPTTPLPPPASTRLAAVPPARAAAAVVGLGLLASCGLLLLVYAGDGGDGDDSWSAVPVLNATLNAACAVSLVVGYRAIRQGAVAVHRRAMLTGVGFSAAFLISYLTYHALHGDTPFEGPGPIRALYLAVLVSHVLLSVVALPLVLGTLWAALAARFPAHRRIARITLPVWLYVSVTGVVVVILLRTAGS